MKHSQEFASVRIVAAGEIRPVAQRKTIPAEWRESLRTWCSFNNISISDDIEYILFDNERLHSVALVEQWRKLRDLDATSSLTLVYLHRGHQADTKTPVLQHLLELLDHRGRVYAFRVETKSALRDAVTFAFSTVSDAGNTLLLYDPTARLSKASEPVEWLHYLLLSPAHQGAPKEITSLGESTMNLFVFQSDQ